MSFYSELTERKTLYPNGNVWTLNFYLNDRLEGERKVWHENGQLYIREFYRAGLAEGERKTYYSDGHPMRLEYYKNDKLEGVYKFWRINSRELVVYYWMNQRSVNGEKSLFKLRRYLRRRLGKILDTFLVPDLVKFGVEK